jgi:hypothetical protein
MVTPESREKILFVERIHAITEDSIWDNTGG